MSTQIRQVGEILHGRYRIDALIGAGAFAEVYRGLDMILEREVAIKMMKLSAMKRPGVHGDVMMRDTMDRFLREARLVSKLRVESTVTLFDFGSEANGDMFMVLEYVNGETLRHAVQSRGRFEAERVARILRQALFSLHEAHAFELLHRDIKPENIMIFPYLGVPDQVRLVDFGIAKALQEGQSPATAAGLLVGTPRYIPPERITMNTLFPASDVYSLGGVAYYLLTGEELYPGLDVPMMILQQQISPESVKLPREVPIPSGMRHIVNRMLDKDLSRRYQQAADVILELDAFLFHEVNARYNVSQELPVIDASLIEPLGDPLEHDDFIDEADEYENTQVADIDLDAFE